MNSPSADIVLTDAQRDFMTFCAEKEVLKFDPNSGFQLKSKRMSPWFFNAGDFMNSGEGLSRLAKIYVDTLLRGFSPDGKNIDTDILYGPAYKGIPLASVVAQRIYDTTGQSLGFASHRKEGKDHGADKGRKF